MDILQKLNELGFTNAAVTSEAKGVSTVRVRTAKGWVYQKFTAPKSPYDQALEDQVSAWANFHKPEVQE